MSMPTADSPRTLRFRQSAAAALAATITVPATPVPGAGATATNPADTLNEDGLATPLPHAGDKHTLSDDDDDEAPAAIRPRLDLQGGDIGRLVTEAIKNHKLPPAIASKLQLFAEATTAERLFMTFLNTELLLAKFKEAADDWETLCRTRIVACFLSPHIPEYKRNPVKHITALIPAQSKHLLPDETNSVHKKRFKTFVSEYAITVRNVIKTVIVKSMTKYTVEGSEELDVQQGWCIGRLCDEIVAKLGTDAEVSVTTGIQSRMALLRFVYTAHPKRAAGNAYWAMVDDTLADQRKLSPAALAHDVVTGLKEDIAKYTVDSTEAYTLVDAKDIRPESMQAVADKAMREYYKTVQPKVLKRNAGARQ